MPELVFEGSLPSSYEFQQALAQAVGGTPPAMTNPVDDLLELANRLREYEQEHNMTSADFYQRYQAGTLEEGLQHCGWCPTYGLLSMICLSRLDEWWRPR